MIQRKEKPWNRKLYDYAMQCIQHMSAKQETERMKHQLVVRAPDEMLSKLQRIAKRRMTGVSSLVRLALINILEEYEKEEPLPNHMPAKQYVTEGFQW